MEPARPLGRHKPSVSIPPMYFRTFIAFGCLISLAALASADPTDDRRFSATLSTSESAQTGLVRLSSDQVAVLDALIRHDLTLADNADPAHPLPARFSQRLSADERRNTGLALLKEAELFQLDADVERFAHPAAPAVSTNLTSIMLRRAPEIHGEVSFMVGGGSHGYSEYGGAIDLNYYNPDYHFSLDVGYSELHSSGGYCNRLYSNPHLNHLAP